MRILNIPEISIPIAETLAAPPAVAAPVSAASTIDVERIAALENVAKSILEKIQAIEERIEILESPKAKVQNPNAEPPEPEIAEPAPAAPVHMDADAVKNGLLTKMWKYLNDQAAA